MSNLEDTPSSRSTSRRPDCSKRVNKVCPHGNRCLISSCDPRNGVQYVHLVPRALWQEDPLMTKLEWYWGMTRGTLNLDTRYNVFPCASQLHGILDVSGWGLLPPDDVVNQYHERLTKVHSYYFADRFKRPNIPNNHFSYRFLPLRDMEPVSITRQIRIPTVIGPPLRPTDFIVHVFPFDDIPVLKSHIHPKFAIFQLGRQISGLAADKKASLLNANPILCSVLDLHKAWSESLPAGADEDSEFNQPLDDSDDDDSDGGGRGGDDPGDGDYSDVPTIPRRDGKRKATMPPSPSARSKRSCPPSRTTGNTLREIRSHVPSGNTTLRVKEWIVETRLALFTPSQASSTQCRLGTSPLHSRNANIAATPRLANACYVQDNSSEADTLLGTLSRGCKRYLDAEALAAMKKRKKSSVEFGCEGLPQGVQGMES
ncbi:hypothetical protein HGRIS_001039 [Hohenbuehelia grisea]|uniref:HNH nuclease domain-containing protein n=1 Tax=Hohenbuehelia grisea TaxID=104357 RepID=A0ABR3JP32_9AGAR